MVESPSKPDTAMFTMPTFLPKLVAEIWRHPANRQGRWRALGRALYWQAGKRLTGRPFDLSYHGLNLRCPAGNHSGSRAIYFSTLPDYAEMRFLQDYLQPGDRFIDAGANLGLYTLLAASLVGESGHVHAFEPNRAAARLLRENLELNNLQNVTLHSLGLSDHAGSVRFNATTDDCTGHVVTVDATGTGEEIEVVRLDELLPDQPYAVAKFDIEGYEPFAIRGASNWLAADNPAVLLVEMAGFSRRHGISTDAFVAELSALGYRCVRYDPETRSLLDTPRPWLIPVENVFAIAESRYTEVMDRLAP